MMITRKQLGLIIREEAQHVRLRESRHVVSDNVLSDMGDDDLRDLISRAGAVIKSREVTGAAKTIIDGGNDAIIGYLWDIASLEIAYDDNVLEQVKAALMRRLPRKRKLINTAFKLVGDMSNIVDEAGGSFSGDSDEEIELEEEHDRMSHKLSRLIGQIFEQENKA